MNKSQHFGPHRPGRPGRRKGARNVKTIVHDIAQEKHKLDIGGKICTFTTAELVLKALMAKAMVGEVQADRYLERIRQRFTPQQSDAGCLVVPDTASEEEWARLVAWHNKKVEKALEDEDMKR